MSGQGQMEIAIVDLVPDCSNPRLSTQAPDDVAATVAVIRSSKRKFIPLLADIAQRGLSPTELLLVAPREDGKFTVLEGNRRCAALHVLSRPGVFDDVFNDREMEDIATARSTWAGGSKVLCVVMSPESASQWIEARHTGERDGAGLVRWNSVQGARWKARKGEKLFELEMYDFVVGLGRLSDAAREADFPLSTLKRVLSDEDFRTPLGVELTRGALYSDLPVTELAKPWVHLVEALATKRLKVTDVDDHDDRMALLKRLPPEVLPDPDSDRTVRRRLKVAKPSDVTQPVLRPLVSATPIPAVPSEPGPSAPAATPASNPDGGGGEPSVTLPPTESAPPSNAPGATPAGVAGDAGPKEGEPSFDGPSTAPPRARPPDGHNRRAPARRLAIKIHHLRLYDIYRELASDVAAQMPNAAAVLLRTFIEGTADAYAVSNPGFYHRVPYPDHLGKQRKTDTSFERLQLQVKLWLVAEHLRREGRLTQHQAEAAQMQCQRRVDEVGSVVSMHAFVHNIEFAPTVGDLRATWDAFETLLVAALDRVRGGA